MEIKVNIPANDYVQPTEVRQEIVQGICDVLIEFIKNPECWGFWVKQAEPLFLCKRDIAIGEYPGREMKRIRGVEMKAAFELMQNAGYYVYHSFSENKNSHFYRFQRKPYCEYGKLNRIDFDLFID